MSVMAWLFGLGAAAVVFPIVFHLIRRTPQGQTEFSSLMFLKPSPPTLTKRSRLDNLWLLLLRALAICLLAFAFMRPFFRGTSELAQFDVDHRRVAILLDVSASMRRGDVWERAKAEVESALDEVESKDQVALLVFDRNLQAVVDFDSDDRSKDETYNNATKLAEIRKAVDNLEPSWAFSDLGNAMVSIADRLDDWHDESRNDETGRRPKLQLIVVSDLQDSSETRALQAYQWPALVKVDVRAISPSDKDNATVELLDPVEDEVKPTMRVRVTNAADSSSEAFQVRWKQQLANGNPPQERSLSFVVPEGSSRVLQVPLEDTLGVDEFELTGDSEDYDNQFFVSAPPRRELVLGYVGPDDPDDPQQMLFYLKRALSDTATRKITVEQFYPETFLQTQWDQETVQPTLWVVATALQEDGLEKLEHYRREGATVLAVVNDAATGRSLASTTGVSDVADYPMDGDFLWGEINYQDPLFQPFSSPAFSDFTSIRFWKYLPVQLESGSQVLARFDNRDPAVWTVSREEGGRVLAIATGWQPSYSQFALSPKFVALIGNLLEQSAEIPELESSLVVGDRIEFPAAETERQLRKPNGMTVAIRPGQTRFRRTQQPGIYRLESANASGDAAVSTFAVNIDRRESDSGQLALEQLERLGVQIGKHETAATELAQLRELRDREIESRQKVWKWLIVGAMAILVLETIVAGRKSALLAATGVRPAG